MKKILFIISGAFLPVLAMAQQPNLTYVTSGVSQVYGLFSTYLVPALMLAAFGYFVWGVIGYIKADSEDNKNKMRHTMIQGVIALAVIVSVWGIVALLQRIFGVNQYQNTGVPCPPGYTAVNSRCVPM